jgi:hypothetical protein
MQRMALQQMHAQQMQQLVAQHNAHIQQASQLVMQQHAASPLEPKAFEPQAPPKEAKPAVDEMSQEQRNAVELMAPSVLAPQPGASRAVATEQEVAAAVREAVAQVEERLGDDLVSAVGALKRKVTAELGAAHAKALEAAMEAEKARHATELASALAASAQELTAAQQLAAAQELAHSRAAAQQQEAAVAAARVALRAELGEARPSGEGRPRIGFVVNDRVAVLWNVDDFGRGDWFRGVVKNLRSELDERGRCATRLYVVYEDTAVEWLDPAERVVVYAWQARAMGALQQHTEQLPSQRQGSPAAAWGTPAAHPAKAAHAASVKSELLMPRGTPAGAAQPASCSSCVALPSLHTKPHITSPSPRTHSRATSPARPTSPSSPPSLNVLQHSRRPPQG